VQEGKISRASFPQRWDDVFQDDLVQEGKLAQARFPTQWDDVFQDEIVLV
jgi:hypothetical protein